MSKYFTKRFEKLIPYVPGEQPQDKKYVKLNTNESPFLPAPNVSEAVLEETKRLQLYSDPECVKLRRKMSEVYNLPPEYIVMVNGSDEILNFAFAAFADEKSPLRFPDLTYGFYPVFADYNNIPYKEIPLKDDFTIDINDYLECGETVVIANPNAPTGIYMPLSDIEKIVESNPENVVIIDEAYIDFGGESAVCLVKKYDNLLVTGTFSKSRSMAGARLGFGFANPELIKDINTLRYSTNPYNVNCMTIRAGIAALESQSYYDDNCKTIIENREWTIRELENLGFKVIPSLANFVLVESEKIDGEKLYLSLKEKGVLVRHFGKDRIKNYNRITIGTIEQMQILIEKIKEIMEI